MCLTENESSEKEGECTIVNSHKVLAWLTIIGCNEKHSLKVKLMEEVRERGNRKKPMKIL